MSILFKFLCRIYPKCAYRDTNHLESKK